MNNNFFRIGLICLALGAGCKEKAAEQVVAPAAPKPAAQKVLARFHFVGTGQLAGNTNASQLRKIWGMPETLRFRDEVLMRLAKAPQAFFPKHGTNAPVDPSDWLRPLMNDLIQAESYGELREESDGTSFALALQLKDERARLWNTNLWQTAAAWQEVSPVTYINDLLVGWDLHPANQGPSIRFVRAGQWVVIMTGTPQTFSSLLAKIGAEGRPIAAATNYWFDAEVDSLQSQRWLAGLPIKSFPSAQVTIIGKGENLRTNMRLTFAEPINWKPEPWQVPTNIIQNPANGLTSFAAARGTRAFLKGLPAIQKLEWSSPPDQLFFWSLSPVPFQSYAAAPVANASNVLHQLAEHLPAVLGTNLLNPRNGGIAWSTNGRTLVWSGLPFAVPHADPLVKPEGEYLVAGLFPPQRSTNAPFPAGLLAAATAPTNRCYYQWEITQERLYKWRSLFSLYYVAAGMPLPSPNSIGQQWLTAVTTNLGNSVTQVAVTSPREMRVVRDAHLNLTGMEIVQLAHWFESAGFPSGGFKFFPYFERVPRKAALKPATNPLVKPAQSTPAPPANKPNL